MTQSQAIRKQLIVFDFDWSLTDQDTDRYVLEVNAPDLRRKMKDLGSKVQWTDLVTQSLEELHERGVTREKIEHSLKIMPFHPAMIRAVSAVKAAESPATSFICLSNANSVFIETILKDKGLENLFDEIITNPAEWDPSGLLKLRRRIDPNGPQHNCEVGCNANMCKGDELTSFLKRAETSFDRVIYVGDGANDYCPVLRLRSQDMVLCRRYRGLEQTIIKHGGLKCQVVYWAGAWEVEEILNKL